MANDSIETNEHENDSMKTLVSCLNSLTTSGFATQFKATPAGLQSISSEKIFQPIDITVVKFFRFEGESNPSDSSILYVIETCDGEKGTLVDGYGIMSDSHVSNFMQNVPEINKNLAHDTNAADPALYNKPEMGNTKDNQDHKSWIEESLEKINSNFPLSGGEPEKD